MIYKILHIYESDFGCEERLPGTPLKAFLVLENLAGEQSGREINDSLIDEKGLEEGKYVYFDADGNVAKAIRVAAAVIRTENKIFATKRGYGDFKGGWEFPGGKLVLKEAEAAKWLAKDELDSVNWLPADITLIEKIRMEI